MGTMIDPYRRNYKTTYPLSNDNSVAIKDTISASKNPTSEVADPLTANNWKDYPLAAKASKTTAAIPSVKTDTTAKAESDLIAIKSWKPKPFAAQVHSLAPVNKSNAESVAAIKKKISPSIKTKAANIDPYATDGWMFNPLSAYDDEDEVLFPAYQFKRFRFKPDEDYYAKMGLDSEELPGSGEFLSQVMKNGNAVSAFSNNSSDFVYTALNYTFARYNISCPAPVGVKMDAAFDRVKAKNIDPVAEEAFEKYFKGELEKLRSTMPKDKQELTESDIQAERVKAKAQWQLDHHSFTSMNDKYDLHVAPKPDPTGILLQKFSMLLKRGVVKREELSDFLDPKTHETFKLRPGYRVSIYIGDQLSDLHAAEDAGFDYFVAIAPYAGAREEMQNYIADSTYNTQVFIVNDLQELHDLVYKPKKVIQQSAEIASVGNNFSTLFNQSNEAATVDSWGEKKKVARVPSQLI